MGLDTQLLSIKGGIKITVFNRLDILNAVRENMGDEVSKYLESEFEDLEEELEDLKEELEDLEEELDNTHQKCRRLEVLLDAVEW